MEQGVCMEKEEIFTKLKRKDYNKMLNDNKDMPKIKIIGILSFYRGVMLKTIDIQIGTMTRVEFGSLRI